MLLREVITETQVGGTLNLVVRGPKYVILTTITLRLKRIAIITRDQVCGSEGAVVRLIGL